MNIFRALRPQSSLLVGSLLAMGIPAFAVPITGGFGTVATGVLSFANGDNTVHTIDFCPQEASSPGAGSNAGCAVGSVPAGIGTFLASGGSGTFSPIVSLVTAGTILDLVDQPGNPPFTYFPVGVPNQNINGFLTLGGFSGFNFQADQFAAQTCAPSGTTVCIGGFILTQVDDNVSVSLTVKGTIFASGFDDTPFTYIVTGQFNDTTIFDVATGAQTTGGVYSNTWSGSLTTGDVPEPGTITMLGVGALAMLFGRLRAKRGSESN